MYFLKWTTTTHDDWKCDSKQQQQKNKHLTFNKEFVIIYVVSFYTHINDLHIYYIYYISRCVRMMNEQKQQQQQIIIIYIKRVYFTNLIDNNTTEE